MLREFKQVSLELHNYAQFIYRVVLPARAWLHDVKLGPT